MKDAQEGMKDASVDYNDDGGERQWGVWLLQPDLSPLEQIH